MPAMLKFASTFVPQLVKKQNKKLASRTRVKYYAVFFIALRVVTLAGTEGKSPDLLYVCWLQLFSANHEVADSKG